VIELKSERQVEEGLAALEAILKSREILQTLASTNVGADLGITLRYEAECLHLHWHSRPPNEEEESDTDIA
jgi:hypothetical protein